MKVICKTCGGEIVDLHTSKTRAWLWLLAMACIVIGGEIVHGGLGLLAGGAAWMRSDEQLKGYCTCDRQEAQQ